MLSYWLLCMKCLQTSWRMLIKRSPSRLQNHEIFNSHPANMSDKVLWRQQWKQIPDPHSRLPRNTTSYTSLVNNDWEGEWFLQLENDFSEKSYFFCLTFINFFDSFDRDGNLRKIMHTINAISIKISTGFSPHRLKCWFHCSHKNSGV